VKRRRRKTEEAVEAVLRNKAIPQGTVDDAEDVAALRAAIELRASRVGADLPSSEAVEAIRRRVLDDGLEAAAPHSFSRRALLAAGGAVAAGVAGVAVDRALLTPGATTPATRTAAAELVPDDGEWVPVATAEQLASGGTQRFAAATLVGFVSQQDGAPVAVSGACTHLGCLLQANAQAGRLDCPCHRTAFTPDGQVAFSELPSHPAPLPRIKARQRGNDVEVFVPKQV
jgi:cytochrome b6-f complex iron-sulfur subunit